MEVHPLSRIVHHLRAATLHGDAHMSDGQLLGQFIEQQDDSAFAALVQRHGPMVWGVCRRVTGHHQDAEDAFQAAFLVLARKANSIRPREMIANWLFGVAQKSALKAKTSAGKRHTREKQVATMPEPEAVERVCWQNLESLVDQELANLPDKYRVAIVLCDLEGKTGKAVARQLRIPEGTLSSRLRTARAMLAKRLTGRGVALSGGLLATVLSQNAQSACAPAALVSSTVKAASVVAAGKTASAGIVSAKVASLTEGALKAMLLTKLKTVTMVFLVLGIVGFGSGLLSRYSAIGQQIQTERKDDQPANEQSAAPKSIAVIPKTDKEKLEGDWALVSVGAIGKTFSKEEATKQPLNKKIGSMLVNRLSFSADTCIIEMDIDKKLSVKTTFKVDTSKTPRWIDFLVKKEGNPEDVEEGEVLGIYAVDGLDLQISLHTDASRPVAFETDAEDRAQHLTFHFKRENPPPGQAEQLKREAPQQADEQKPHRTVSNKGLLQPKKEKIDTVAYPVADLVFPILDFDNQSSNSKDGEKRTREGWLINKITQTVTPASWKDFGGAGTMDYDPRAMRLVVKNSARVQSQVNHLLETMRRVQDVQVVVEIRIFSLGATNFVKLQRLMPHLEKDGHVVLSDLEMHGLDCKIKEDGDAEIMQFPKITFFPGQRVGWCTAPSKESPEEKNVGLKFTADLAANLQDIDLDFKASVDKLEFAKALRLVDGATLAQFKREGDVCLIFLVTPRVIFNREELDGEVEPPVSTDDKGPNPK
jgi:RNA polymerase sigma factor (sigma-70 family)